MTTAKKRIFMSAKRVLETNLSRVYSENLKLTIAQDRRTPEPVRRAIHDLCDEVWQNIQYEIDRAFRKMIEAVDDERDDDAAAPPSTPASSAPSSSRSMPQPSSPSAARRPPTPPPSPPDGAAGGGGLSRLLLPAAPSHKMLLGEDEIVRLQVTLMFGMGFFMPHRDGLPDVVVKLSVGGTSHRSRIVHRTLQPVWGAHGQAFWFSGPKGDLLAQSLELL
eukprot:328396-Prymnesium_polylepis.2